jgi:serine O-acetyltransferase
MLPGMIASIILRAQQCLHDAGHIKAAGMLRSVAVVLVSADFSPGMKIGPGLNLVHPVGLNIGHDLTIGEGVTFAAGVTCAAKVPDATLNQEFATICDGAIIGAYAVLLGPVRIGRHALVGANSVVTSDVPDYAVVLGVPARQIGTREASADVAYLDQDPAGRPGPTS